MDVRWGFVGAGNVTDTKASPVDAFSQDHSRVVAVARTDKERAEDYARKNGIDRAYWTVEDLCHDPEVNAVYICTPHHLHKEHALTAIRAGKHVLCEKPLSIATEDGLEVVREADRAGILLAVPYYRRFYPVAERLEEIVRSGTLGTLTSAQAVSHSYFVPHPSDAETDRRTAWRTALEMAGGGALNENGSHRIDLLVWLFGEPSTVAAVTDRFEAWYEGEDQATITIRFANRVIAQFDQSWCNRAARDSVAVAGTHGHAIIHDLEGTRLEVQVGPASEVHEVEPRSPTTHRPVVTDFVQALAAGGKVRCSGAEALRTSQIVELAYSAARQARTVDVPQLVGA